MNNLMIGDVAPDFTTHNYTKFEKEKYGAFHLHGYKHGMWCLLASHPADFTPVCDGELCTMQSMFKEFLKMKVQLVGLSVDSMESHEKWMKQFKEIDNLSFDFPIIADENREIATKYGMVRSEQEHTKTVRSTFIIDPDNIIRAICTYPAEVGRDFNEIKRVITALQLSDKHPIATPVNWKEGAEVVVHPSLPKEDYNKVFPQGTRELKPYLHKVEL